MRQEGHVGLHPLRLRVVPLEDQSAGGESDAQIHHQLPNGAGRGSVAGDLFPATHQAAEREAAEEKENFSGAFQAILFTVITLHFAVSYTCPVNQRSRCL